MLAIESLAINISILSTYMISYISWKEISDENYNIKLQYDGMIKKVWIYSLLITVIYKIYLFVDL